MGYSWFLPLPFALPLLGLHGDLDLLGDLLAGGVANKAFDNGVTGALMYGGMSTSGTGVDCFAAGADFGVVGILFFCAGGFFSTGDLVLAAGGVKIGTDFAFGLGGEDLDGIVDEGTGLGTTDGASMSPQVGCQNGFLAIGAWTTSDC